MFTLSLSGLECRPLGQGLSRVTGAVIAGQLAGVDRRPFGQGLLRRDKGRGQLGGRMRSRDRNVSAGPSFSSPIGSS